MIMPPPYFKDLVLGVIDMIDQTIGVLKSGGPEPSKKTVQIQEKIQEGYAFIAMPMDPNDAALVDVLDGIKEAV